MNRVVHFEIHADDPERCSRFYSKVFGWQVTPWDGGQEPYWLVTTGPDNEPGINGGIMRRRHPMGNVYNSIQVASVDASVASVLANGGKVAMPKMAIPGVGWLAYCNDTEGNIFGLMQEDRSAK